ncbi:DNA adenine methylase [Vibrio cholerae]|nr:DNA adenine methylase [Vibrio cholerae]HDY8182514.1 DNA adenine methylase [Vibrio vulnificus]HDZ9162534.1 DNA adenine methylase [Vibrio cholerae]
MKPLVKWAGGKTWLAKQASLLIHDLKPQHVVEPFAGSAAFSLFYEFSSVSLNDANPALMNLYRQLANGYEIDPTEFVLEKPFFEALKIELNAAIASGKPLGEREASVFWYLCKHSYNGLVRQNKSKGEFNMPFGLYDCIATPPNTQQFMRVAKNWSFNCGCFSDLDLADAKLTIIDPPYEKTFNGYTKDKNENLQDRILGKLRTYDGAVIATNTFLPELVAKYRAEGFSVYKAPVRRSISCKGSGRGKALEMVAFRGFSKKQIRRYVTGLMPYYPKQSVA